MRPGRAHGTARERATVVAMIFLAGALPLVAKLPLFQSVVWLFWLAALVLMAGALTMALSIYFRRRRSGDS